MLTDRNFKFANYDTILAELRASNRNVLSPRNAVCDRLPVASSQLS